MLINCAWEGAGVRIRIIISTVKRCISWPKQIAETIYDQLLSSPHLEPSMGISVLKIHFRYLHKTRLKV